MGRVTRSHTRMLEDDESRAARAKRVAMEKKLTANRELEERIRRDSENAERIRPWIEDALQSADQGKREEAIATIREAMFSRDPAMVALGMKAFLALREIEFDKASFRAAILPHLEARDEELRTLAWSSLVRSGLQPEDAAHMREIARSVGMGDRTSYLLFQMENGDLRNESGKIVKDLLGSGSPETISATLRGISHGWLSPELESQLVALSREPATMHDAVYFGLRNQQNKGDLTVRRLLEDVRAGNHTGDAAWGLGYGVTPELKPMVADTALEIITQSPTADIKDHVWQMLVGNAGPENVGQLKDLAARADIGERKRLLEFTISLESAAK